MPLVLADYLICNAWIVVILRLELAFSIYSWFIIIRKYVEISKF